MVLTVLGIESSCDETAVAIMRSDKTVLAHKLRTQLDDHRPYGGVVPEIAARAHLQLLPQLLQSAMDESGVGFDDLDAIGVTSGPGLIGGLLVGVTFAQSIGFARDIPIYGLNHLEGHALTSRFTHDLQFPYLLLLVSGGHSQFLAIEGVGQYRRLGTTMDDAVGEAFDKTAKILGFGYPGGPFVERAAHSGDPKRFALPIPMRGKPGCDLSLSGLKTAVRHMAQKLPQPLSDSDKSDMAASFQYAVAEMLADRLRGAIGWFARNYPDLDPARKILSIAGGVSANQYIYAVLQNAASGMGWKTIAPPLNLCGDNAVMIAHAAIERINAKLPPDDAPPVRPRWPLDTANANSTIIGLKS